MPWCPKCHTEYIEGFDTCADCQMPLVDVAPGSEQKLLSSDLGEPVLLLTVPDTMQADMLLALLETEQIPAYQINRGVGGYLGIYMGMTSLGTDIYVPEQLLKKALEIAETLQQPVVEEEISATQEDLLTETSDEEEVPFMQDMRGIGRFLLWFWLVSCIVGVLLQVTGVLGELIHAIFG